jgi:hypothetical protein
MVLSLALYALALAGVSHTISVDEVIYPRAFVDGDWTLTQDGYVKASSCCQFS